jgi:cytochrome oxidase assembly protein ShyY1
VFATFRQRRYLGMFGVVLVIAFICVALGTWQIFRFDEKRAANQELRNNNKNRTTEIAAALGPASAPTGTGKTDEYRHVTATGHYLNAHETLVRGQSVGEEVGYLVLTPFQTDGGVLLVARGFISQTQAAAVTPTPPAAPTGTVSITARLEPAGIKPDRLGALPDNQVLSVNPANQSARLRLPVWNAYAELLPAQPGDAGLTVIPDPDLSNPAGGAEPPQHAAYVVQWYLFAGLALAMPFVLAAAERRREEEDAEEARLAAGDSNPSAPQAATKPTTNTRKARRADLDDRLAGRS